MTAVSPRGRGETLDVVTQVLGFVKDACSIKPAQDAFDSTNTLLTMIRAEMANDEDCVQLGLSCADVCMALDRGLKGRQLDELSRYVLTAIEELNRIVIGIQKKVKQGKRNVASLFLRVKGGKDRVAAWRRDLVKVLQVFNTELAIGTHMVVADIHRNVLEREDISSQEYSIQAIMPLGESPPPAPEACFGRNELIEEVIRLAGDLEHSALIGPAGIGKTSIALTVLHHERIKERFGENRRFMGCDQFPPSPAHFLARLSQVVGAGLENPGDLRSLLPFLSSGEMFIILDSAELALDPHGTNAREIYNIVQELCHVKRICLCITSRVPIVPPHGSCLEVPPLSMEAACDIFYHNYGDGEWTIILDDLIQRLDFNPLSITLLATTASYNAWDHDQLAQEWAINLVQELQPDFETLGLSIELSLASSPFRDLGPNARDLLEVIACFPHGIDTADLHWLFPTIPDVKKILNKFGFLSLTYESDGFVHMPASIRDYLGPQSPRSFPFLCAITDSDPGGSPSPPLQSLNIPSPLRPSMKPVCIGQLAAIALIEYQDDYLIFDGEKLGSEDEWAPVSLRYGYDPLQMRYAIHIKTPTPGGPSTEPPSNAYLGEVERQMATKLGPMLVGGTIELEAKIHRGLLNLPMLSLLLLVYTSKPNIPCVSQHFHQHGLSLDHPKLPSDQNRLQSEEYLNPHYPLSGGFSRAGTVPGGTIGRPTNGSAGRLPTPVRRHSEERQEKAGGLPSSINHTAQDPSIPVGSDAPAWKRLINPTLFPHEVISLIEEIFTGGKDKVDMICDLLGDDAQTFINVIHEARDLRGLSPHLQKKCLRALCRICTRQVLLPKSLQIPICYDRSDNPLFHGGFADVWKGEHKGRPVAVKVLRMYSTSDVKKITSSFCKEVLTWNALHHPNVLPLLGVTTDKNLFAMVSEWMLGGNINEFIKTHPEANPFELLQEVACGLIYIHDQGMIHGDLKGVNILIDQDGHVRLADFGLLAIVSDHTGFTTSGSAFAGGTTRWMSPELLHPEHFGYDSSRPTKESDCYALGMVVYEVLTGQHPFPGLKDHILMRTVPNGERPVRPEGVKGTWFTDDLWEMLGLCWSTNARDRPSIATVRECLKRLSRVWKPLLLQADEGVGGHENN